MTQFEITESFKTEYRKVISKRVEIDEYMDNYINDFAQQIVDTTFQRLTRKDELNNITYDTVPIEEYFKVMDLTKYQIKEREETADDLLTTLLFLFALIDINKGENRLIYEEENNYWLSVSRATEIAENESNTALNYKDYQTAINAGYTKKTWLTERDSRVRKTHKVLESKTIPINDLFMVGNTFMRFPKDTLMGESRESVNCRCAIKYSK